MMTAISSIFLCKKANFTIQAFFEIFKLRNLRQAALLMEPEIVQQNGPMLPHRPNNVLCIINHLKIISKLLIENFRKIILENFGQYYFS